MSQLLNLLARADIEATRAMRWIRQLRTSGGSSVPDACVLKQPMMEVPRALTDGEVIR
jgi:hypothetical protein